MVWIGIYNVPTDTSSDSINDGSVTFILLMAMITEKLA
jgi:hypothetical protein